MPTGERARRARVSEEDASFLDRAAELGRRGWGRVSPNPMVGCVVVRAGEVVGEGWHREVGGPHAEVHALAEAGGRARGATAYTSLEPCAHTGRTPPCTRALIDAGVARVVFGASDPGAGAGGAAVLRAAGTRVDGPAFPYARAVANNPAFFHAARQRTPYLALKLALSLDGRISRAGEQTALTGQPAREHVHHLRAGFDAILVGANTMAIDDPRLTVRGPLEPRRPPERVVLDSRARISPHASLFREVEAGPVRVFTGPDAPAVRLQALRSRGAAVHTVPRSESGVDLGAVLDICYQQGLTSLLCEGGGVLASSLLREGRVQRLHLYFAPRTLGPGSVPAFPGLESTACAGWRTAEPPLALGRDLLWVLDREG